MKIWVTGAGGMLGRAVARAVQEAGHDIVATGHGSCAIEDAAQVFDVIGRQKPEVIINCAGRLPGSNALEMVSTNALGPHVLASTGVRLIHMSTDCVFSGLRGKRPIPWLTPQDRPDPMDLYGRTKLAGEPEKALVVRGSFIGAEGGFLHWLLEPHSHVNAWLNAKWNGLTAEGMANVLVYLATFRRTGVVHVASETAMSKAEMVSYFVDKLDLPIQGIAYVDEPQIDRRLEPDALIPVQPLPDSLRALVEQLKKVPA